MTSLISSRLVAHHRAAAGRVGRVTFSNQKPVQKKMPSILKVRVLGARNLPIMDVRVC